MHSKLLFLFHLASLLPSLEKRSEDISFLPFGGYFDQNEDFDDGEEEQQLDDEAVIEGKYQKII